MKMKKKVCMRLLSLLLMVSVFFMVNGISVLAETVDKKDVTKTLDDKLYSYVTGVSIGGYSVALMKNGDLYKWSYSNGEFNAEKILREVSWTNYSSAAILENGDLYCWGDNSDGQVGNGTTTDQATPIKILSNVVSFSDSTYRCAAITEDGDLFCWGRNQYGQVGNGLTEDQTTPVKILSNVKSVSLLGENSAAITKNGDLYCWGYNLIGQVGNGIDTEICQTTPVKILGNVSSVFLESHNVAAITENGDLYCWGSNRYGQVGNDSTYNQTTPVKILSNVVSFNSDSCCTAITEDGSLYSWGNNENSWGLVGNGTTTDQSVPIKILGNVSSLTCTYDHNAAITKDGDLYCWGRNLYGRIGNGTTENQITPIKVLSNVSSVSLNNECSAAITTDGELYLWGRGHHGLIGNGTTENQTFPIKVLSNVESVSWGYQHNAAITRDGDLYCWGSGACGQLGDGSGRDQTTPVKVLSDVYSISLLSSRVAAITTDGDLYYWGGNTGEYSPQYVPVKLVFDVPDNIEPPEENEPDNLPIILESAIYTYGTKSIDLLTTAHSIESTHNPFDLLCTPKDSGNVTKYELYSGNKKVAESTDGSFKQVKASEFTAGKDVSIKSYGDKKAVTTQLLLEVKDKNPLMNSSLNLGGKGVAFTLGDDVPFIGGSKISVNFPEVPINVVVEDGKIKVGINITKESLYSYNSYEGVTTTTKEKSMKQKIADWKKTLYKTTLINQDWKGYLEKGNLEADIPFFSKDKSLTVFGYAEGEWSDSFESLEGEIVIAISTSRTWQSKPIVVFQTVPVTFNCKLDAEGKADGTLKVDFAKNDCFGDVTLSGEIAIEPYAGVGVGTWLSLGVYGQLKTGMDYTLLTSPNSEKTRGLDEISLYGEAGAKGYFAKKEVVRVPVFSMGDLKNTNLGQFIDSGNKLLIYSRDKNSLVNKKSVRSNSVSLSDEVFVWSEENASVYMSPYVADSGNRAVTLIENAYGAAEPQIITAGNTTLVAYLDNDESRALPNQTVVKYAVYNPITGAFSEPQIVLDDDTADYKPQLYTDGTDIYAYYLDSTKIYGETDDPDISEYAGTFAVTVAKYDKDSGNFTKLGTISQGNHYSYSPILTSMGDSLFLAWAENGSNQVFGLTQDNSVNYSIYKDEKWCEPVNVSAELNSITSIAVDGVDGQRKIAYCVDADNDLTTMEQQLYLSDESGTITKCMEDIVSNLQYIQLPELGHKVLVFNRNGAVAYMENADSQPVELFEEQTMDSGSQFIVQGNKIYYLKTDENSRNVCCANYAEGQWGSVGMTDESSYIDAFSVTDGMLVYLATDADFGNSEDIQTSSNIKILSSIEKHDLTINNVSFDELNMKAGEELELEVGITNNGTETVSNSIVTFYRKGDESLSQSVPLSCSVHSGETVQEKITVTAPEDFKDAVYSLKIEETDAIDNKETDNLAEVDLSKTELDISAEYKIEQEQKSLLVRVSNDSNVSSKADVSVSDSNGDVIYTKKNVDVPANDSVEISVPIEESLLRKNVDVIYTATVNTDKEEYYLCNNTYEQRVWQIETWEPVVSDIPDKEDGNGEEQPGTEISKKYNYKLNDDNTTITITKCTSSDTNIVIPSSIDGYTVTEIGDKAFQNVTSMKTVSFPSTLKSIGNYAFAGCTSLTTLTLPDSLTNLGTYVFKGCTSLKSAKLNAGRINVTEGLFHGCTLLSSVTLPSSVQYIREYAFYGCSSLKTLSLPKSLVTVFNNAFLSSGIKSIKYAGTSTNWKKITIYLIGNTKFFNATVTGSDGKTFSADSSKWNTVKPVKKPTVSKVKSFKATAGKKKLKLTWKKLSGAAGYQIQISTKKNFKGAKKISISKSKKTYTKKKLKAKKKYYIRIRAYKTYKDANKKTKKVYGNWTTINKKTK